MELLLVTAVAVGVKPEGSEALLLWDHKKFGEGTSEGKVTGSKRVVEHVSE